MLSATNLSRLNILWLFYLLVEAIFAFLPFKVQLKALVSKWFQTYFGLIYAIFRFVEDRPFGARR